jgi:anti-anti-sigma factor
MESYYRLRNATNTMELIVNSGPRADSHEARVLLRGELAGTDRHALDSLQKLVQSHTTSMTLVLDGVTNLNFGGLGILIRLLRYARERGCNVQVETSNDQVKNIFDITALSRIFKLRPTQKAA